MGQQGAAAVVTMEALHCQRDAARYLVEDKGGDYRQCLYRMMQHLMAAYAPQLAPGKADAARNRGPPGRPSARVPDSNHTTWCAIGRLGRNG